MSLFSEYHEAAVRGARPMVIAHRGASGLAPENTIAAFGLAVALGADGVELDVQLSADGRAVVMHDTRVNRTTNGAGAVERLTADELGSLDAGAWFERRVAARPRARARLESAARLAGRDGLTFSGERVPSLDEALALLVRAGAGRIYVELKGSKTRKERLLDCVISAVRDHRAEDRVTLLSFDHAIVRRAKEVAGLRTAATFPFAGGKLMTARSIIRALEEAGADEAALHFGLVTRRVADAVRGRGLALSAWTANSKLIMRRLVACGVDSIMTNYPDRLVGLLASGRNGKEDHSE